MYPDLITPKSYPDKLQEVAYDPFHLMPAALPSHPRVLASQAEIERTKERIERVSWAKAAMALLLENTNLDSELPEELPAPVVQELSNRALHVSERLAMAYLLTGQAEYRERGLVAFRKLARAYPQWTINAGGGRASGNSLGESHFTHHLGRTYDLLAACGLSEGDETLFREMLYTSYEVTDHPRHLTCSNHNTWRLCGRLAVAAALGDRQGIHDVLYGYQRDGHWRYGLIHQLRHDILPDGLHWERTPGYHYYTLMGFMELADMFSHIGTDIWHVELPMQQQHDGNDIHRVYGPRGTKSLKVAFDAPFYQTFADGNLPMLSDSGLENLRGVHIWGPIYEKAYEAYGDEKYAWLLNTTERAYPERKHPELPMSLQTIHGDLDFVRLAHESYPAGRFTLAEDCRFAPLGRLEQGCTLFPAFGAVMLRSDPTDIEAPAAYLFYGPHNAGHQSPAALHIDLHAGKPLTSAPDKGGYEDPDYLTWIRTTIAHNTVTVDETPMFPYDFPTDSIWESDQWRDTVSDGELLLFQPDAGFSAMRAINENVYSGVCLNRTVIVTRDYIIDAYRVISEQAHQYDWAMHCIGELAAPVGAEPIHLGEHRGYRHMTDARAVPIAGKAVLNWTCGELPVALHLITPDGGSLIMARDLFESHQHYGALAAPEQRTGVIVRTRSKDALFLSLWQTGEQTEPLAFTLREGDACSNLTLEVSTGNKITEWQVPFQPAKVSTQIRFSRDRVCS